MQLATLISLAEGAGGQANKLAFAIAMIGMDDDEMGYREGTVERVKA